MDIVKLVLIYLSGGRNDVYRSAKNYFVRKVITAKY